MNLSEDTINLLRDDAYLTLSREAVHGALERALVEKNEVATTRPPFGILATKKSRETFERSMHTVINTEAALQNRLSKLKVLETALYAKLRTALHEYLASVSEDYNQRRVVLAAIDAWDALIDSYGEQLQAFARELRNTVEAISSPTASTPEGFEQRMLAFAELHMAATGVDGAATLLEGAALEVSASLGTLFASVRLGQPPFLQQAQWVDRVTRLVDTEIVAQIGQSEIAVREVLSDKLSALRARSEIARNEVNQAAGNYLETYWKQLRTHAIAHYIEERDVDDVINMLTERYITAELQRSRQRVAQNSNLYEGER